MKKTIHHFLFFLTMLGSPGVCMANYVTESNIEFAPNHEVEKLLGNPGSGKIERKKIESGIFNLKKEITAANGSKLPVKGGAVENGMPPTPVSIDFSDAGNILMPGKSLQWYYGLANPSITMDIGIADTNAQTWTLPANILSVLPLQEYADCIAPSDVTPPPAQVPGATHVIRSVHPDSANQVNYLHYELTTANDLQELGWTITVDGVLDQYLGESPELFADLPLDFGDAFISNQEVYPDDAPYPYYNLESDVNVNGFGAISTPFGVFDCLRMSLVITQTHYPNATDPPSVTTYHEVAFAAKNGFRFHGRTSTANASGVVTLTDPVMLYSGVLPACTTLSSPANGAGNIPTTTTLNWAASSGSPVGYRLDAGTSPNGAELLDFYDAGNVTSVDPPGYLPNGDSIFVKVMPYNTFGIRTVCPVSNFSTENCTPDIVIENQNIASGTYWSQGELTSGNQAAVPGGKTVAFKSDTGVLLQPNFEVLLNGVLDISVQPCPVNLEEPGNEKNGSRE